MSVIQRDQEISQLYDLIMSRAHVYMHAPSGMGKTHLINDLFKKLEGRRICFYLSASGMVSHEQLLRGIEKSVKQTAARYSNLEYQLKRFFEEHPMPSNHTTEAVNLWFESLLVAIQNISQDFLFVIEDLDQWEGDTPPAKLFASFFGARNSQLLMTANIPDQSLKTRATTFELPALKPQNFTNSHSNESMENLLRFTRGNTAFILDLFQDENPGEIDLQKNINQVMAIHHPSFQTFRKRFTDLQWRLLKAIAYEDKVMQPHSFDFLMTHRLGAASSVERALKNLADTDLIIRTNEGWQIENVVLQRWVQWLYSNRGQNQKSGSILTSLVA